jgi:type II secretory pathway pseudopilin PulG
MEILTEFSNSSHSRSSPQYGLNPSQLQTRRNDGEAVSMGQRLGSDSQLREQMRATFPNDEQSLSGFSFDRSDSLRNYPRPESSSGVPSDFTLASDKLSNYSEPSRGYTASLSSGFTVGTDTPSVRTQVTQTNFGSPSSSLSDVGRDLQNLYREPTYTSRGRPAAQPTRTPFRESVGVPMGGNPSLKSFSGMEFLPRKPLSDIGTGTTPMVDVDSRSYSSY